MALPTTTAILVDFDGTLANSIEALRCTYFEFLAAQSKSGSETEFSELNGPSLREIVTILSSRHELDGTHEALYARYMTLLEKNYVEQVQPFDTAETFLHELSQSSLRTALVTSTPKRFIDAFIDRFRWGRHFEAIVSGDEVTYSKPHPEIYAVALAKLALEPSQAIAIEDSINGVRAAHQAGVKVIAVDSSDAQKASLLSAGAFEVVPGLDAVLRAIGLD